MATPLLAAEQLEGLQAVQHADDLQRDRALRRPPAAPRLPAAHDPLPVARTWAPIVGYAVTSQTAAAATRPTEPSPDLLADYLRYVAAQPGPKIAVGAGPRRPARAWGPSSARSPRRSTRSSAASATSPSGCPRDLDEVHALGFQLFGLNPCVSHAYVRLVDFGKPVTTRRASRSGPAT